MNKKIYQIDLRNYNLVGFLKNPVVVWSFDWVEPPVGQATIATDRRSVAVEFFDESLNPFAAKVAEMELELLPAYVEDGGVKELISLSVSPKKA